MGISENLKKLRQKYNLTQEDLAKIAGVTNKAVSTWETGKKEPRMGAIERIANHFGLKKSNLIEDGGMDFLDSDINNKNTTGETAPGYDVDSLIMIPVVGAISCGNGCLAYEDIQGYEPVPKEWLSNGEHFFLRAKGDSMIGARIYEGDLLLIKKQSTVADGEIAAVLLNDSNEAVLKRVFRRNGILVLQSENPKYPPILSPPAEVRILGKLVMNVIKY